MFHYVEPDEENIVKRQIVKKYVLANEGDRGLGQTKPSAENLSELVKSCEDIETQCTILLKSLDQVIINDGYYGTEASQINKLFIFVRKGLSVLKRMSFQYLPKTDIQNLNDYHASLTQFYNELQQRFATLFGTTFKETPKNLRISRSAYQNKQIKSVEDEAKLASDEEDFERFTREAEQMAREARPFFEGLIHEIDVRDQELIRIKERLDGLDEDIQYLESTGDDRDLWDIADLQRFRANLDREYQQKLVENQRKRRMLEEGLGKVGVLGTQIQNEQLRLQTAREELDASHVPEPSDEIVGELTKGEVLAKDYELIFKQFKTFLDTLSDGLLKYNAGLSGKVNKKIITDFRTPIEEGQPEIATVVAPLKGAGRVQLFSGYYNEPRKRFL